MADWITNVRMLISHQYITEWTPQVLVSEHKWTAIPLFINPLINAYFQTNFTMFTFSERGLVTLFRQMLEIKKTHVSLKSPVSISLLQAMLCFNRAIFLYVVSCYRYIVSEKSVHSINDDSTKYHTCDSPYACEFIMYICILYMSWMCWLIKKLYVLCGVAISCHGFVVSGVSRERGRVQWAEKVSLSQSPWSPWWLAEGQGSVGDPLLPADLPAATPLPILGPGTMLSKKDAVSMDM